MYTWGDSDLLLSIFIFLHNVYYVYDVYNK